jgi:hypothetical protein
MTFEGQIHGVVTWIWPSNVVVCAPYVVIVPVSVVSLENEVEVVDCEALCAALDLGDNPKPDERKLRFLLFGLVAQARASLRDRMSS